jgi:DNA repair exonuclease SbcCD nuclease subunit
MRIGSSADWHLCAGMDADIEASVRQIAQIFHDQGVQVICLPGDLFDRKSTPEGRNLLRALVQELAKIAPVFICYGNHDEPGDLDIFGEVKSENPVYVFDKPTVIGIGDNFLHILPWFTKSTWQSAHAGASKEEGDKTVSQMALDYLKYKVKEESDGDAEIKHILMGHLNIEGARAENHQPLKGEGIRFGRYDLVEAGFCAGIFGHIHLRQVFEEAGPTFFYNGSPAALDYGESPEKYCSILDTDSMSVEWFKLNTVDRFSLDLTYGKDAFITIAEQQPRICGARVRALLKIPEGEDVSRAKAEVEKRLLDLGALEAQVDPQIQPKDLVRAAEIASAETLEQKLEAYWKANDNCPSPEDHAGMKEKLAHLEGTCR